MSVNIPFCSDIKRRLSVQYFIQQSEIQSVTLTNNNGVNIKLRSSNPQIVERGTAVEASVYSSYDSLYNTSMHFRSKPAAFKSTTVAQRTRHSRKVSLLPQHLLKRRQLPSHLRKRIPQ